MHNNKGFTLIELIAVLLLLGVLTAFAVPRFLALDKSAELKVVEMGLMELNARESLYFADYMLTSGDADIYFGMSDGKLDGSFDELIIEYEKINYDLVFRGTKYKVSRSITHKPHHWSMGRVKTNNGNGQSGECHGNNHNC